MALRLRHLHEGFGVEVLDVDLNGIVGPALIDELRQAYDEHQMLLFRCGRVSPERQVEVTRWFGRLSRHSDGKDWTVLHNENAVGSARLPFHSDFSYTETPLKGISLHAIAVPPSGTSTTFASAMHGWATLAPEQQDRLAGLTLRHLHHSSLVPEWPNFVADHPLRLPHPRTGKPILFSTEQHATRIHQLEQAESDALIDALLAHLYAFGKIYVHRWELDDLLIWDNLAIQHARTQQADIEHGERAMQRVALADIGIDEIIVRARNQPAPI
jgi:taurine dioxygenase